MAEKNVVNKDGYGQKVLLTEKDVSNIFGISHNSLRRSRVTGELWSHPAPKFIKVGSVVRYRREDIESWINQFELLSNTSQS